MAADENEISRRNFIKKTGSYSAAIMAASSLASCGSGRKMPMAMPKDRPLGANERINIAVIGIHGRGWGHAAMFAKTTGVQVKTLCDIDENLFADRVKDIGPMQAIDPAVQWDIRRVLDDKDIDAVAIALPNHWHALAAIWACQAGKHVYLEKPSSHNIWEGRKIVEASRKYNRLVQVGFQNRSIGATQEAIKFLHSGGLGDIYMSRALCFKARESIGHCPDGIGNDREYYIGSRKAPTYDSSYMSKVHYDTWLGPARERPFNYNRFHYNWHWFWDYGGGDITNTSPHFFDLCRWGMNKNEHPRKISSMGGYFVFDSDQETPNTQTVIYQYSDGTIMQQDMRAAYTNAEAGIQGGSLFYGSKGWMSLNNGGQWKTFFGRNNEPGPNSDSYIPAPGSENLQGVNGEAHVYNFANAIRSGKKTDLNCDIEQGHISSILGELGNISYKLGRTVIFDGKTETFVSDRQANNMLARNYRKPFVVPQKV